MRHFHRVLLPGLILTALPLSRVAAEEKTFDVMIKARDMAELATTVYLPDGEGPWPCVLSRTPYNKNGLRGMAKRFVKRGYAFVGQDCRGRHKSPGKWLPFRTDPEDGYDTVEWIARQSWSNGKVGMHGGSALGMTTNLAATQTPPHLKCAYVIVAPASARRQTVYMGGVYRKELNDGWLLSQGAFYAIAENISNRPGTEYWNWREISDFHRRMEIPVCQIGGWFDIFSQGTIDNFSGLQANGAGLAAGNQKLVMGPYAHGNLNGRLKFPDDSSPLSGDEAQRWFDRWLKDEKNGIDKEPPVRYYVLGDPDNPAPGSCQWRTTGSWPPPSRPTSYFLWADRSLRLDLPPPDGGQTTYRYDPNKPVPTRGGANLILGGKGPMDQREIGKRQDYVRFVTEPLDAPLEIAGRVYVDLYVESDAPDTDFVAKLVDVYPDGYEALILDGILRARYREGLQKEVFLKPGEVVTLRVDLWSTAIVLAKGHRLGVHITSSNDPRFEPNRNTGKALRESLETRIATNTFHHSSRRPSRILLPVVTRQDGAIATPEAPRPAPEAKAESSR